MKDCTKIKKRANEVKSKVKVKRQKEKERKSEGTNALEIERGVYSMLLSTSTHSSISLISS